MEHVGEHPIPIGPLAPRWLAYDVGTTRAGAPTTATIVVQNAGTATWRSNGTSGVQLAYHWLDPLGNPIVWDGIRTALPHPIQPGESVTLAAQLVAPRPPGRYKLALDLVEEHHFWFETVGSFALGVDVDVLPRITARRLSVVIHGGRHPDTEAAVAAQEEPLVETDAEAVTHLVAGAVPATDWSRLLLDAHVEGWHAVGPAVVPADRRSRRRLAAWRSGGRNPRFGHPLLLPSLLSGLQPTELDGLPAWDGDDGLFDGRIEVRLRPRSDRRPT